MTCGTYSADCTNVEHGRIVQCESVDTVFFPFTQEALPDFLPVLIAPPPPTAEPTNIEEIEDPIFETRFCRCEGRRGVLDPPRGTPTDDNGFYIINGITVIPRDDDICTARRNINNNGRKLQNNNMQMMGGLGGGGGMMMNGGMMNMNTMNMGMGQQSDRFVCPSVP
jgi:hypothetical protein